MRAWTKAFKFGSTLTFAAIGMLLLSSHAMS